MESTTDMSLEDDLDTNETMSDSSVPNGLYMHYIVMVPIMIILCVIAVIINLELLIAAHWVRKPMSPIIFIYLSLAVADIFSAGVLGIGLFVNSWLPIMKYVKESSVCHLLLLEALRLGGIIVTVFHLLYLTCNHYIGVLKPIKKRSILTRRFNYSICTLLWICPFAMLLIYFSVLENDGFQANGCGYDFMTKSYFRIIFSSLFFGPFALMVVLYAKVFGAVKEHLQRQFKYRCTGSRPPPVSRKTGNNNIFRSKKPPAIEKNLKAVYTTLMILGSYVIGWMPGTIYFLVVCDDCLVRLSYFSPVTTFYICSVTNLFIIFKTITNPIIYGSRSEDFKAGRRKMHIAVRNMFHKKLHPLDVVVDPLKMSTYNMTRRPAVIRSTTSAEWNTQMQLIAEVHPLPNIGETVTAL